jgi:hypothetical protein
MMLCLVCSVPKQSVEPVRFTRQTLYLCQESQTCKKDVRVAGALAVDISSINGTLQVDREHGATGGQLLSGEQVDVALNLSGDAEVHVKMPADPV